MLQLGGDHHPRERGQSVQIIVGVTAPDGQPTTLQRPHGSCNAVESMLQRYSAQRARPSVTAPNEHLQRYSVTAPNTAPVGSTEAAVQGLVF